VDTLPRFAVSIRVEVCDEHNLIAKTNKESKFEPSMIIMIVCS
jgi:hypothetical protein